MYSSLTLCLEVSCVHGSSSQGEPSVSRAGSEPAMGQGKPFLVHMSTLDDGIEDGS